MPDSKPMGLNPGCQMLAGLQKPRFMLFLMAWLRLDLDLNADYAAR